ncbi:hypothetical protein SCANM63S_04481 [Streptomyces canarius]
MPGRDGQRGQTAAEVCEQGAGGAAEQAGQRPVVRGDRGVQGADPAVAGAGDGRGGDRRRRGGRRRGQHGRQRTAAGADPQGHDDRQAEYRRRLDQGGEGDEDGADDGSAAPRGDQAQPEQAEHQGVVVGARDQVQQHQRIQGAEPQGGGRVGAAVPGETGQRHRHQGHAEQGDQTHAEQAGGHLPAGQCGQRRGEGQEGGAVGGAGVPPHRGDLAGERAAEPRRAVGVDVHVGVDHGALREIAVHVPAEQRRGQQQRGRPHGQDEQQGARGGRLGTADQPAQEHPGGDEQDDPEVHPDQAERGLHRGGRQEVPDGQGAGRLTAEREEGGAGQAHHLAAAEIDGERHGQHLVSVSTPGGRKETTALPGGSRGMTGTWWVPAGCPVPARRGSSASPGLRPNPGPLAGRLPCPGPEGDAPQNTDSPVRVVKRSRAATPATELPRSSSPGLHTQSVHRPGTTAMIPPPTPLLPGRPTR